ncbi:MAG: nucleotidyl transferase AbiEii/AbiGii toxin family protein [Gammaproteobacteria bacterium]
MIPKQEIMDLAREFSLEAKTVEKDYVLGWLLAGIETNVELRDKWIFKGGTCLKKCYFETYRFSEDLDYTLVVDKHLNEDLLKENFKQVSTWIYDNVGIEIPNNNIRFNVYQNNAGKTSVEGSIYYIGPLQRRGSLARIKLDLTADEILVLPKVMREVHHPYSDKPHNGIRSNCYSFPEIFAEKIRALGERARPRDLYDVIHLYRHADAGFNVKTILDVLRKKCEYKKIPLPTMQSLNNHAKLHELESEWGNMLAHQLPMLPSRDGFWQELPNLFAWLYGNVNKISLESAPVGGEKINPVWKPPSMIRAWHVKAPLELIRYAAANHLCIELAYNNTKRLIEPYDLKQTKEGNLIVIAVKHKTGEHRSYCVDRIQGVEVTALNFMPRYAINMTPLLKY